MIEGDAQGQSQTPPANDVPGEPRAIESSIIPKRGQRALVVGHTGSGKTEFSVWLLERLEDAPIIIYDTKGEEKFERMPRAVLTHSLEAMSKAIEDPQYDYVILRVSPHMIAEGTADTLLWHHFTHYPGVGAYIDELFSFSQNGRAGPGLTALLTQGRSKKITTIMSTQRPVWMSRFALTETQRFYIFRLIDWRDKRVLADVIPGFDDLPDPPEYGFWYFDTKEKAPQMYGKINILEPVVPREDENTDAALPGEPSPGSEISWL